ncbi:hypothetical protein RHMOL_Rhmol01G0106400 [Rhododendron molle]|uniref:Uncharacterized protein n=1 Tax=Rhododendron molle TaxID=49168 RepID=A0ACC0Q1W7_RHOML|nr:hypothetical protein RHMOL_Rhmol01G0106400 [Rhododendron molle]
MTRQLTSSQNLLASTQTGIWNPVQSGSNHQNSINNRSTGGSQNQTAYTNNSRSHHNTTIEKRDPAATAQKNYYPPPTPIGSGDTRLGQKSGQRGTSSEKKRHKKNRLTTSYASTNPNYYLPNLSLVLRYLMNHFVAFCSKANNV